MYVSFQRLAKGKLNWKNFTDTWLARHALLLSDTLLCVFKKPLDGKFQVSDRGLSFRLN